MKDDTSIGGQPRAERDIQDAPVEIFDMQGLPVEIFDGILRNIHEDKLAILACSRVSRLWREIALPYLFASIDIYREDSFDDLQDFLDTNIELARLVRRLRLTSQRDPTVHLQSDSFPILDRTKLRNLTAALPQLEELHLYMILLVDSSPDALGGPDQCLPTRRLETLTIEFVNPRSSNTPQSFLTFFNTISVFTSVKTLVLTWPPIPDALLDPAHLIRTFNVDTLISRTPFIAPEERWHLLYDALRKALVPGCLRALHLGGRYNISAGHQPATLRSFGQLVRHAAPNALRIDIPFPARWPVRPGEDSPGAESCPMSTPRGMLTIARTEHWRDLNLSSCTSVTTVMHRIHLYSIDAHVPLARVCIAVLANVPTSLRVFTLRVHGDATEYARGDSAERIGLRELDTALIERFERLERVEVMVFIDLQHRDGVSLDLQEYALAVSKAMPRLQAKGMLQVSVDDD
ncbi:hypothetical protein VTO73DRAFT_15387 [Trametes versicolor]